MAIFEAHVAEGFEWVVPRDERDFEIFHSFDGRPRGQSWRPIPVERVERDEGKNFKASDFPWLNSSALVLRERALDELRDLLVSNGEILALETNDGIPLVAFNARVIDALDEEKSSLVRFPESGRIMRIRTPVFRDDVVQGVDIFRLPHRGGCTYLSNKFVERVKQSKLVGLIFKQVSPAVATRHR